MATVLFFARAKQSRQKKHAPVSVLIFAFANFYGQFVNSLRSNTTNWPWNLHANAQALKMGSWKPNAEFCDFYYRTLVIKTTHYFCLECVREFLCSICLVWGAKRRVTNWVRKLGLSSRKAKVQVLSFAFFFWQAKKESRHRRNTIYLTQIIEKKYNLNQIQQGKINPRSTQRDPIPNSV